MRGRIRTRAGSRTAFAGRRASSTRARSRSRRGPGSTSTARPLRAPRRHVLGRGHVRRRHPAAPGAPGARRDRDRADAGRDLPRFPRLGVRRALHLCATAGIRRPGGVGAARRRGASGGARRDPRRRLQPHRPWQRGSARIRAVLHRSARRDAVGRRARLRPGGRPGVGAAERGAVGARLPDRRPPPRRRACGPRRLPRARPRRAGRPCSRSQPGCSRGQRDGRS